MKLSEKVFESKKKKEIEEAEQIDSKLLRKTKIKIFASFSICALTSYFMKIEKLLKNAVRAIWMGFDKENAYNFDFCLSERGNGSAKVVKNNLVP